MEISKETSKSRENSSARRQKDKNNCKPDIITEEDFDAFCSGKTEILFTGIETPCPPESRLGTSTPRYENSYRLEPKKRFRPDEVKIIIENTLCDALEEKTYSEGEAKKQALILSERLKDKVKSLNYPRFKLVCSVQIGQKNEQDVHIGSRCLWNKHIDSFACGVFTNTTIYAVACVYAVYFE